MFSKKPISFNKKATNLGLKRTFKVKKEGSLKTLVPDRFIKVKSVDPGVRALLSASSSKIRLLKLKIINLLSNEFISEGTKKKEVKKIYEKINLIKEKTIREKNLIENKRKKERDERINKSLLNFLLIKIGKDSRLKRLLSKYSDVDSSLLRKNYLSFIKEKTKTNPSFSRKDISLKEAFQLLDLTKKLKFI